MTCVLYSGNQFEANYYTNWDSPQSIDYQWTINHLGCWTFLQKKRSFMVKRTPIVFDHLLTHWPLGDVVVKSSIFKLMFYWLIYLQHFLQMLQNTFDDKSTLVQVMAWCSQATSHYLNQCWPRFMLQYVNRPQRVNFDKYIWRILVIKIQNIWYLCVASMSLWFYHPWGWNSTS